MSSLVATWRRFRARMQALLTSDDGLTRPIRAQSVSLLAAPSSAMYMMSGFSRWRAA